MGGARTSPGSALCSGRTLEGESMAVRGGNRLRHRTAGEQLSKSQPASTMGQEDAQSRGAAGRGKSSEKRRLPSPDPSAGPPCAARRAVSPPGLASKPLRPQAVFTASVLQTEDSAQARSELGRPPLLASAQCSLPEAGSLFGNQTFSKGPRTGAWIPMVLAPTASRPQVSAQHWDNSLHPAGQVSPSVKIRACPPSRKSAVRAEARLGGRRSKDCPRPENLPQRMPFQKHL